MYQANGEYGVYTLSIFMYVPVPIYQPNCLSRNLFAYLSKGIYPSIDRPMKVEGMATPLTVIFWSF